MILKIRLILILISFFLSWDCHAITFPFEHKTTNSETEVSNLDSLENHYAKLGYFQKAYDTGILNLKHITYPNDIISERRRLAYYKSRLGEYNEAIKITEDAIEGIKFNNLDSLILGETLDDLATYYSRKSDYNQAIELGNEALLIIERNEGKGERYAKTLNNLSHYWYRKGEIKKALLQNEFAISILKAETPESLSYADALVNHAHYLSRLGKYIAALEDAKSALQIKQEYQGDENTNIANILSDLATYHSRLGEYIEARELENKALAIRECKLGKIHPDYARSLAHLAHYSNKLGDHKKALSYSREALDILSKTLDVSNKDYIDGLDELAKYYAANDSTDKAIEIANKALNLRAKFFQKDNLDYANAVSNIADYLIKLQDYNNALELEQETLNIRKNKLSENHQDYAKSLYKISKIKGLQGQYEEALEYGSKALHIQESLLHKFHPDVIATLMNITELSYKVNDFSKTNQYIPEISERLGKRVKNDFRYLPTEERELLWNIAVEWFFNKLPYYISVSTDDELLETAYNSILFSKGVLLNGDIEFRRFLNSTGNHFLKNKYRRLQEVRNELNSLYEKPLPIQNEDVDSLENLSYRLEMELIKESNLYGDFTENLSVSWQDIRNGLKGNEAAIEFVSFQGENGSRFYIGYIIRKDSEHPIKVKLFEEADLVNQIKNHNPQEGAGQLVWGNIRPFLGGINTVYFSPDGILHQLPIESFPDFVEYQNPINERYNLYRLSSTRQLLNSYDREINGKAVLIGGINYNTDIPTLETEEIKQTKIPYRLRQPELENFEAVPNEERLIKLPSSEKEINEIVETFKRKNLEAILLTGDKALEKSIKNLDGEKIDILHISTHGFYYPDNGMTLSNVGLYMAGANNLLSGKVIPDIIEDGVLKGNEISTLNLSGIDLLVLSACNTGLGDIKNDGVYGLQRSFKKSGVNTILMTLWEVDDVATGLFMENFYKILLEGNTKVEALQSAQNMLMNFRGFIDDRFYDFSHPRYWSAFILLDALN